MSIRSSQNPLLPIRVPVSLCCNHTKLAIQIYTYIYVVYDSLEQENEKRTFSLNTNKVLNAIFFLLDDSPASEFYMPTLRNTLFHLHMPCAPQRMEQAVCFETCRYESISYLLTWSVLTSDCRDRCNHSGRLETVESLVWYRGFRPTKCDRFKNFVNFTIYQILG